MCTRKPMNDSAPESARCFHCKQKHKARDPQCSVQRQEEKICNIQNKEKIPWMAGLQKYFFCVGRME